VKPEGGVVDVALLGLEVSGEPAEGAIHPEAGGGLLVVKRYQLWDGWKWKLEVDEKVFMQTHLPKTMMQKDL
jgi:hypothetical protein